MTDSHLWAVGFDDVVRAEQVRDIIADLAWGIGQGAKYIILEDIAVVVRHADGTFTFDRKPFAGAVNILGCSVVGFLAGPSCWRAGATVGISCGWDASGTAASAAGCRNRRGFHLRGGADDDAGEFLLLFVLADEGDMEMILHEIRGLGGTVLKTNVDQERARLIQSTLAAHSDER